MSKTNLILIRHIIPVLDKGARILPMTYDVIWSSGFVKLGVDI